jgi:hypothetical protein
MAHEESHLHRPTIAVSPLSLILTVSRDSVVHQLGHKVITILMLAALLTGCGTSTVQESPENVVAGSAASFRDRSPQQYLAAVFSRYRNAASYHDRGIVRLAYTADDRHESKIAPMQVWFDHDRLYVEAYDVKISSDVHGLTAWINDPDTSDFDSQVLRLGPIGRRPTLEALLPDPILATRVSGGLAGPPPQLEWLFARDPMKRLFHARHRFEYGGFGRVDDQMCRNVLVHADGDVYQFWIDQRSGVIRRVDLPPVAAPPSPGEAVQMMSLSLELKAAAFNASQFEPDLRTLPQSPKFVRQFVPLPAIEPPAILGSRPRSFQVTDTTGQLTITDRGGDRELLVLVRYCGDPRSWETIAAIVNWNAGMPDSLRKNVRLGVLVDPQATELIPTDPGIPVFMDRGQLAAGSLKLQPGSLLILNSHGEVAWSQSSLWPAPADQMVKVGAIVSDLLNGVDVPRRVRDQWASQVRQYRQMLERSLVEDSADGIHLD